jgi:hypothetical protein
MTRSKRDRARLRAHWRELNDDDCIDPREFFGGGRTKIKENRKGKQLCRQVAETLEFVLSGETNDELLSDLRVVSVVPAPDSSQLLVTLAASLGAIGVDCDDLVRRLSQQQGRPRCQVAAAITRK